MPRVAIAQVSPVFLDKDRTVEKGISVIAEAARGGAELVAFPETWIPGYPMWVQGSAGWDIPEVKRSFARLSANAVTIDGPELAQLADAAAKHQLTVVVGVNERDAMFSRSTLYNTLITISHEGRIIGAHRKLIPTHGERLFWGMGDGSDDQVFDTPIGRVGGTICWEHWMPLHRFAMHAQGEQIHVAAFPDVPSIHQLASRSYAFEGRSFVLATGAFLTLDDVPHDFEMRGFLESRGSDVLLNGGSGVVGPDGEWIVEPLEGQEAIIYADLDLSRIAEEKLALDTVGHYNRPDVYELNVLAEPRPHIRWPQAAAGAEAPVESAEEA